MDFCCQCNKPKNEASSSTGVKKICRLCLLSNGQLEPIFMFNNDESLSDKIFTCTAIEIHKNKPTEMPLLICGSCKATLYKSYQFRENCIKNDEIFKNIFMSGTDTEPNTEKAEPSNENLRITIRPTKKEHKNKSTEKRPKRKVVAKATYSEDEVDDSVYETETESGHTTPIPSRSTAKIRESKRNVVNKTSLRTLSNSNNNNIEAENIHMQVYMPSPNYNNHESPDAPEFEVLADSTAQSSKKKNIKTYNCEFCGDTLTHHASLRKHYYTKHPGKIRNLKCTDCKATFVSTSMLGKHRKAAHNVKKNPYAPGARRSYNKRQKALTPEPEVSEDDADSTAPATKKRKPQIYSCDYCRETFTHHSSIKKHYNLKHPSKVCRLQCTECNRTCVSIAHLEKHKKAVHNAGQKKIHSNSGPNARYNNRQKNRTPEPEDDDEAEGEAEDVAEEDAEEDVEPIAPAQKKTKSKIYRCEYCGETITYHHASIKKHFNNKHPSMIRNLQCTECKSTFVSTKSLEKHKKRHKNGESTLLYCVPCEKYYQGYHGMWIHKRTLKHKIKAGLDLSDTLANSTETQRKLIERRQSVHQISLLQNNTNDAEADADAESAQEIPMPPRRNSIDPIVSYRSTTPTLNCHHCTLTFNNQLELNEHLTTIQPCAIVIEPLNVIDLVSDDEEYDEVTNNFELNTSLEVFPKMEIIT